MKKEIKQIVFAEDMDDEFPENPEEFFSFWEAKLGLIPKEFKATAKIEIEAPGRYEGCTDIDVTISYIRTETDEEEERRERSDRSSADLKRQRELGQLAALKEKYPGV